MTRVLLAISALGAAALLVGCGGDEAVSGGRAYFLHEEGVWPVARELDGAERALEVLYDGPSDDEVEALGLETRLSGDPPEVTVADGVATVELGDGLLPPEALAQVVFTLTQFPEIERVAIDTATHTRADFEDVTPAILVESPLPFEEVATPLTVTGTANTFEANFHYELLDADGNVVDENFVTATSGTGTRGTFEFTTADVDDVAALVVFETSAEDGSRMREVRIPLTQAP